MVLSERLRVRGFRRRVRPMFRCELCDYVPEGHCTKSRIIPAGTAAIKVAVAFRATEYPSRPKANKLRIGRKSKRFDDPGGAGYEIEKEVLSCASCAQAYALMQAQAAATQG